MSIITTNSRSIWNFFKSQGLTEYGIAGLMGNLYAESGLSPINLENTGNTRLGKSDGDYTASVDSGDYDNFIYDGFGYGLAQWTWWSRKKALYEFNKTLGMSIGDLSGQLKYLMTELEGYSYTNLIKILKTTKSVKEASDAVLIDFERPADMSDNVKNLRASYGQEYYDYFHEKATDIGSGGIVGTVTNTQDKSDYIMYIIVKGDTLWSIANRFGVSVIDIVNANRESIALSTSTIYPDQIIYIPTKILPTIQTSSKPKDNDKTESVKRPNLPKPTVKKFTHPILERFSNRIKKIFTKK